MLCLVIHLLFSPGTLVSSASNTDHHDKTEILLKVALNTHNFLIHASLNLTFFVIMKRKFKQ